MAVSPKRAGAYAVKTVVMAACGLISLFVLAAGYESVYNRSLPYVHTLDAIDLSALNQSFDLRRFVRTDDKMYGQFGKPTTLKFSGKQSSLRLDIGDAIVQGDDWLARTTSLHAVIPQEPKKGNISTLVLYCRASFRTISSDNLPSGGGNVFVDTDQKWRYVYKVISARTYQQDEPFVPTASQAPGKLLVVCNDAASATDNIIEADLLSVQGVDQ